MREPATPPGNDAPQVNVERSAQPERPVTPEGTVHVVAHTHWDREWYHTAERFRQRLVSLVDELLDAPPAEGTSFLLDGQAVLLEDYLSVRPERAAELSALLREGRLEAGPWYVLADELIPGGEALVRNLLAGRAAVHRLRGEPPPVLYCPDSFGHPAILPELAIGFGCAVVVLWRGYGGARWPAGDTVRWRGPAGGEVVLHHLSRDGYELGGNLPLDAAGARERWRTLETELLARSRVDAMLLLNGADHHARQVHQPDAIRLLSEAAAGAARVTSSSLRHAAEAIAHGAARRELPVVSGELRDSYGYTWTLQGTFGTRARQKRASARAERLLVRDVEPWLALQVDGAGAGTRALMWAAWRELLKAHPHDTLCGTSLDEVATAFDARVAAAVEQGEGLREDALLALADHDRDAARANPLAWRPALLLRNPCARRRRGVAELVLSAKIADVAVGPGSGARMADEQEPPPFAVDGMFLQLLSERRRVALTEAPRAYPDADLVREARALGWCDGIGGYELQALPMSDAGRAANSGESAGASPVPAPVLVTPDAIDNGLLRVSVSDGGEVSLLDHRSGRQVRALLRLERMRDVGDLYTPAVREALPAPAFVGCSPTLDGPLRGELALAYRDELEIRLQLDVELPVVRIVISGTNHERDQRLRIVVATDVASECSTVADAAFHPQRRELPSLSASDEAMEHLVRTAPLHRYVTRFGASTGATIYSDGLGEYESLDDGSVAITLVRSVGELSRRDLPERPGHAGWPTHTPGAQMPGPFEARLALALHGADTSEVREVVERLADDVLLPIVGETLRSNVGAPRVAGGIELEGEGLAFSAAMPARREGWIVLRCVNRRSSATNGRWRVGRGVSEASYARLDETPTRACIVRDGVIEVEAGGREIVTIVARMSSLECDRSSTSSGNSKAAKLESQLGRS